MIEAEVKETLAGVAAGRPDALEAIAGAHPGPLLPGRDAALARLAASIALDAPPATYAWQVRDALEAGLAPEDLVALLRTVAPQVGTAKATAAAPEIMLALGLGLPAGMPEAS